MGKTQGPWHVSLGPRSFKKCVAVQGAFAQHVWRVAGPLEYFGSSCRSGVCLVRYWEQRPKQHPKQTSSKEPHGGRAETPTQKTK